MWANGIIPANASEIQKQLREVREAEKEKTKMKGSTRILSEKIL